MFRKWIAVVAVIGILVGVVVIYKHLPSEFFSQEDTGSIDVNVELPTGTKLTRTAKVMRQYSHQLQAMPEVKTVITSIGRGGFSRQETNEGELSIQLVDQNKRKISTQALSFRLKKMLEQPGVDVTIRSGGSGGGFGGQGGGIRLSILGSSTSKLQAISDKIKSLLKDDPDIISIDNGRSKPMPQLHYLVDRQRISRMNSTLNTVAQSLKTQIQGTRVGYFQSEDERIPIRVQAPDSIIRSSQNLADLPLLQVGEQHIPANALGHFESTKGVNEISRRDQQTVLDLNINVKGNPAQLRQKILTKIKQDVILPDGYRYSFTGNTRQSFQIQSQIEWALLFSLLLTYMIMASLFENLRDPFVIFFTIPLAFFGAFAGLFVTKTALASTAFIGIFVLVGIIVNNGIVLVDYIHLYNKNNKYSKSMLNNIIEACRRRMRPILLTALTTICSMIPLALGIGTGASGWSPLGKTVIGGMLFGTILTLFIIPVFVIGIKKERRKAINEENNSK
jgi:HAE1 family hydrophobic/amphiphilic exporter-1